MVWEQILTVNGIGESMRHFDVVIIGSGPAGVSVAERLYEIHPEIAVAMIERGSILLRRHFYNNGGSIEERDIFLAKNRVCPWRGDLEEGGALLPALGGRGIVGGSQLHRFYEADFYLWPNGLWPLASGELNSYFKEAEDKLLGGTRCGGQAQENICKALADLNAQHPPCGPGVDVGRKPSIGFSHHSSVQRILAICDDGQLTPARRPTIFTGMRALRLVADRSAAQRISHVLCTPSGKAGAEPIEIHGRFFVLAASAIESARLVLASGIEYRSPNVGRYLTEHIYCRGYLNIATYSDVNNGAINIFIPPQNARLHERYQIEIFSVAHPDGKRQFLRVTGSAAMDPQSHNRVTLSSTRTDSHGIPRALTRLRLSRDDERRKTSMLQAMCDIAAVLGGSWSTPPSVMPKGASYHEAGTLRISHSWEAGSAAPDGLLFGVNNVYVGDGSAFTSVGVANPILTLTALGYRLADRLASLLRRAEPA